MCEVLNHLSKLTKVVKVRGIMSQCDSEDKNGKVKHKLTYFIIQVPLTHSRVHNFSYLWHRLETSLTSRWKLYWCIMSQNIALLYCTILIIFLICYTVLFWDTRYFVTKLIISNYQGKHLERKLWNSCVSVRNNYQTNGSYL